MRGSRRELAATLSGVVLPAPARSLDQQAAKISERGTKALDLVVLPALAQTDRQRIDQRQLEQERRIEEGVKSGQINATEAKRLRDNQERIRRMEAEALADGKLSPQERQAIEAAQDRQSERIKVEKTDRSQETNQARIDQRQARQQQRIEKGRATGELTPDEVARLQKGQEEVRRLEQGAAADGRLTRKERLQIEKAQDDQSAQIRAERKDREKAAK